MEIILSLVVGLAGIAAGWALTHRYASQSTREMSDQYAGLVKQSREQTKGVLDVLKQIQEPVAQSDPQLAREVQEKIVAVESDPSYNTPVWSDGDQCPKCQEGRLSWAKWAPGPAGFFSAWFRCHKCASEFPGFETFGD